MALVERIRRRGANPALAAAAYALVSRYTRALGNEALTSLTEAIERGASRGIQAIQSNLSEWIHQYGNELGNQAVEIANSVREAANNALQQGGELYDAITSPGTDSLTNSQQTTLDEIYEDLMDSPGPDMQNSQEPDAANANNTMVTSTGGISAQAKETPISIYPTLTYGLQETHTTILPWVGWCSYGYLNKTTPLRIDLRMNAIWDVFPNSVTNLPHGSIIGSTTIHNRPVGSDGSCETGSEFPATMTAGTTTTERPQWRDYWAAIYEYYTVLGCEWKFTITNESARNGRDVVVAYDTNSYTDTSGATGNRTPLTSLKEMMAFKGIKWQHVPNTKTRFTYVTNPGASATVASLVQPAQGNTRIISGRYKPGSIHHNIRNDGDVKTWTATTTTLPTLHDFQTFYIYADALALGTVGDQTSGCGNIQIELKYIVQFKDLKQQARYPNSLAAGAGGAALTQGINFLNTSTTIGEGHDNVRYTV